MYRRCLDCTFLFNALIRGGRLSRCFTVDGKRASRRGGTGEYIEQSTRDRGRYGIVLYVCTSEGGV
jgi:hypothetical protein